MDISATDSFGKSPLFYAAAKGDLMSVYFLTENRAHTNDGSLHEAARICQDGIVSLLLEGGHDPDYASPLHGGRTPLGELCFSAILGSGTQAAQAFATIKLLIHSPTDLALRVKGKTVLHLALENDQPVEVTNALLRFPEIYKDIRDDSEMFLFEDSHGISMSPDRYVTEYCSCSDTLKRMLISLLESKQCKEKWFKKKGAQLPDCKGLPQRMKEAMDLQDLADQAELRAMRRRAMSAKADLDIENERHKAKLQQSKEQMETTLHNSQRMHQQQLAHDNALSSQRRSNANLERQDEQRHLETKARIEHASLEQKYQLEYSSQKQKDQQRYDARSREMELERKMIKSREAAEERSHNREFSRMDRRDASVKLLANEQKGLIEAARRARVNVPQDVLMLGNGEESSEVD